MYRIKITLDQANYLLAGIVLDTNRLTKNLTYKRWYCGHYHTNENLPKNTTVLYHQIIPLGNLAQF